MEISGQLQAPAALSPRKEPPAPIVYEAGCAPDYRKKFRRNEGIKYTTNFGIHGNLQT